MALKISEIYNDVVLDNVNSAENGNLNFAMFNRLSKRAELRMIDFLSGDVENIKPPTPYTAQKDKDILSPFIKKFPTQVVNGEIVKPSDFYGYENMYLLGQFNENTDCEDEPVTTGCNVPIELLDGAKFYQRCITYIEGLQPSFKKPIAKILGDKMEFLPQDLGSIILEYYRYPVFGKIVSKPDPTYNDEVIDEDKSTNYEWAEYAREVLVYFITDTFAIHTRESALKQQNQLTGKLVRDTQP